MTTQPVAARRGPQTGVRVVELQALGLVVGSDTDQVLFEAGLDAERIAHLRTSGVVA